jgi:hypothetical protein
MQPSSIPEAHLLSGALLTEVPSLLIGQVSNDQLPIGVYPARAAGVSSDIGF